MDAVIATLFALLAGAGTALSPCVLPVLPVALSAGASGGRRRPAGVAIGLAATFGLAAVFVTRALDALGLPADTARHLAVIALAGFGLALIVPRIGAALEARLSRMVRVGPAQTGGDGFGSGLVLGASLALVYAPCAGPILAAVVALDASVSAERVLLGVAYGVGAAAALFALMLLGRRVMRRLARHTGRLQQALGVVMVATAVVLAAGLDQDFQTAIARDLPSAVVDPTRALERSGAIRDPLARAQGRRAGAGRSETRTAAGKPLPRYGAAPEFVRNERWFNTPGGKPLTLAGLRGRVVLIDFWTYTCINCLRTLPYATAWDARYRKAGLTVVGVHTPEFGFERDAGNVAKAIAQNHIRYPVAQDNAYGTWDAWANQYWPAEYLVDATGQVRYASFGEGESAKTERAIRSLLAEAGRPVPGDNVAAKVHAVTPSEQTTTPETYLGSKRAQGFRNGPIRDGERDFGSRSLAGELGRDQFAFRGHWRVSGEDAEAGAGAQLQVHFHARRVYLVLSGSGRVRVAVDGRQTRVVRVREQKLYPLVELPQVEDHVLTLDVDPGLRAYAFTFG